jgi:hypothetical protein
MSMPPSLHAQARMSRSDVDDNAVLILSEADGAARRPRAGESYRRAIDECANPVERAYLEGRLAEIATS